MDRYRGSLVGPSGGDGGDRAGGRGAEGDGEGSAVLVVPAAAQERAGGEELHRGAELRGSLHPGAAGGGGTDSLGRGAATGVDSAGDVRPYRAAADAGGSGRFCRRRSSGGIRAAGRSA